jgi:hypothetical protein
MRLELIRQRPRGLSPLCLPIPSTSEETIGTPKTNLDEILAGKHPIYQTFKLKNRLFLEKGWEKICSSCGLTHWLSGPIPLELDHIDGDPFNHKETNLRLLCPNCHALTDTYRAKNKGKRK